MGWHCCGETLLRFRGAVIVFPAAFLERLALPVRLASAAPAAAIDTTDAICFCLPARVPRCRIS